jgi:hypothetical protein
MTGKDIKGEHDTHGDGGHEHEPVEVAVVEDKRDTFGKRVGIFAIGLLIFIIAVLTLIQSGKNGEKIDNKKPNVVVTVKPIPIVTSSPVKVLVPGPVVTVIKETRVPVPQKSSSKPQASSKPQVSSSPKPQPSQSASPEPQPVRSIICRVIC